MDERLKQVMIERDKKIERNPKLWNQLSIRENRFCEKLAELMCYPCGGIEIGGVSESLLEIVQQMTKQRPSYRHHILNLCEDAIQQGKYDKNAYESEDPERVFEMMCEDYDRLFYGDKENMIWVD